MKAETFIIDRVLKFNKVHVFCSFFFLVLYPIMVPSGPSDSASTQRGAKPRVEPTEKKENPITTQKFRIK